MELETSLRQKVLDYQPSEDALDSIRDVLMVLLVGITGAGKNTILHRLFEKYPDTYHLLVSHTTRAPRMNNGIMEQDGVDYHFIDLKQLDRMLDAGEFIEVQPVHAHIYGSSIAEVMRAKETGRIPINDIDIKGVDRYVALRLNVRPVFVVPPDYDTWYKRFTARYGGSPDRHDMAVRVQSAIREIKHALEVDYFYIVINDDLDHAVEVVHQIAHGEQVDPHYPKAMEVARMLLERLRSEYTLLA